MDYRFLTTLLAFNFIALLGVTCVILRCVIRKEVAHRSKTLSDMRAQEKKLECILEDLSHVGDMLYKDIRTKEKELQALMEKASEKILLLSNVAEGKYEVRHVSEKQERLSQLKESRPKKYTMPKPVGNSAYARIYNLSDNGYNIVDIARMVNKTKGEVELILNLRNVSSP